MAAPRFRRTSATRTGSAARVGVTGATNPKATNGAASPTAAAGATPRTASSGAAVRIATTLAPDRDAGAAATHQQEAIARQYDTLAPTYDADYDNPRWQVYDRITLDTIVPHLPARGHVLDAGAGTGKFAVQFLARGLDVTLLDPSRAMLDQARKRVATLGRKPPRPRDGNDVAVAADAAGATGRAPVLGLAPRPGQARFAVGSIDRLEFPEASFDFVFSEGDPLSYCRTTRAEAARELVRVLRPGGWFYVSCDSRWFGTVAMLSRGRFAEALACAERGDSWDPYGNPVHAFLPAELRDLFAAAGAVDLQVTGKGSLVQFLADATLEQAWQDPSTRDRLQAVESAWAKDPLLAGPAAHLHITGRKPVHA